MTRESGISKRILKYLNSLPKSKFEKRHGGMYSKRGAPDIQGCYNGQHCEFEVKGPGGKVTTLQMIELERWREAGAVAAIVTGIEDVQCEIEKLKAKIGKRIKECNCDNTITKSKSGIDK